MWFWATFSRCNSKTPCSTGAGYFLFLCVFQKVRNGDPFKEIVDHLIQPVPHGLGLAAAGTGTCRRTLGGAGNCRKGTFRQFQDAAHGVFPGAAVEAVATAFAVDGIHQIALGKQGATHSEIIEAAKIANAHDFIEGTAEGYQTNIGDRGAKLSGGQRQRLSIARAVLKNPEFLILDEATSALDTESEKLVQDALTNLLKGRTSIVIAHRLSTIYNADRIYVIDQGHVAEQGTHQELLDKGGIYAHLIEMQSFS